MMSGCSLLVSYFAAHRLFGQSLCVESETKNRYINACRHTFFRAIKSPTTSLTFNIWVEHQSPKYWPAYCCVYDKYGAIVNPSEDARFLPAFTKYFGSFKSTPVWVNCEFATLSDLIDFLHAAHI